MNRRVTITVILSLCIILVSTAFIYYYARLSEFKALINCTWGDVKKTDPSVSEMSLCSEYDGDAFSYHKLPFGRGVFLEYEMIPARGKKLADDDKWVVKRIIQNPDMTVREFNTITLSTTTMDEVLNLDSYAMVDTVATGSRDFYITTHLIADGSVAFINYGYNYDEIIVSQIFIKEAFSQEWYLK